MESDHSGTALARQSVRELRAELARKIACFIGPEEKLVTPVPGLFLARRTAPTGPCSATYEAGLIVIAQGRKRVDLGQTTFIYDESRFLLTSVDLPIPQAVARAWGAALVLMLAILIANIGARVMLARTRAKMGA